jgi:hypothetical protein
MYSGRTMPKHWNPSAAIMSLCAVLACLGFMAILTYRWGPTRAQSDTPRGRPTPSAERHWLVAGRHLDISSIGRIRRMWRELLGLARGRGQGPLGWL